MADWCWRPTTRRPLAGKEMLRVSSDNPSTLQPRARLQTNAKHGAVPSDAVAQNDEDGVRGAAGVPGTVGEELAGHTAAAAGCAAAHGKATC
mmetsp:Transcript_18671/g.54185  ORF Transcript_18671/g.54185 Transcript_18671/m.54185 type:complete len:92 (+) Transcript_18671:265-540(+)